MATDMEACMKAATPGEEHERIKQFAGKWTARIQHWMDLGAPPQTSTGTMNNTWTLGGRFLRQDFRGDSTEHPFEGTGYFGFNNVTGQYEGFWIDIMSTGMMTEQGSCDEAGATWSMTGQADDPSTGGRVTKRSVVTVKDADHHSVEMFFTGPDGRELKAMQIDYTRAD